MEQKQPLSPEESDLLADLLDRVEWPLTPRVFNALCGKVTTTGIELVVLRHHQGRLEVLLHQRPDNDPHYAGQWHTSGTVLRGHETDEAAFARLVDKELGGTELGRIEFVTANHFHPPRGAEVTRLFVTILPSSVGEEYAGPGKWYPLGSLPSNLLAHHITILEQVLDWHANAP